MRLKWISIFLFLGMLFAATLWIVQSSAQSGAVSRLSPPLTDTFPTIKLYLDVHDPYGNFIHGLTAADLKLIENNKTVTVNEFTEVHPGVQFVLAFSPGHALSIRDGLGFSRFDYLIAGLNAWQWDPQTASQDDLSLVTVDGPEITHVSDPDTLLSTLRTYQPNLRNSKPNLEVLSRAIQIAEDEPPRPEMERLVLFITPPQPAEATAGLQSLAARASQLGVRINVWLVASPDTLFSSAIAQMQNLTSQTGGVLFPYTGNEEIPNIETYLDPLRHIYHITYTSALTSSGNFPIFAEINTPDQTLTTNEQEIVLSIQPPNPILISPPTEITRKLFHADQNKTTAQMEAAIQWTPTEQTLEIFVEYPDGYPRSLVQSLLLVDGIPVHVNTAPPFEKFSWDIRPYTESGMHVLQVEIQDSFGLANRSLEIPVQVTVEQPSYRYRLTVSGRGWFLVVGALIFAGIVVTLVLVLGGRIKPNQPGKPVSSKRKAPRQSWFKHDLKKANIDPVTQPVQPREEEPARNPFSWSLRLQRSHPRSSSQISAFLTPVLPSEDAPHSAPIPITSDEIIFGCDPIQSTWVIDDPSLEPLHARLIREGHAYRLIDAGTVAGTWINSTPVSPQGDLVENGDTIHLGRVCFRFTVRPPTRLKKPVVLNQERES